MINEIVQLILFLSFLVILSPLLGRYMAKVYSGEDHFMKRVLGWMESLIYRVTGINEADEMDWKRYVRGLILFNICGFVLLYLLLVFQSYLPLNREHFSNVSWHLAFNTAVSFVTNTNWQSYSGENTLGYLVQMLGLTVQNFVSAATGLAVAVALIRGLTRKTSETLGNFWTDITRSIIYILLPLSVVLAIILMGQGVVQTFSHYEKITTLEGASGVIPLGPAASQVAIKQLGTNGGGFFGANSAHPFENPTPLTNFLEMFALIIISAGLVFTYGHFAGSRKQAWSIFITMFILLLTGLLISLLSEYSHNQVLNASGVMEGKETRFGVANSVLFSVLTSATSCGAVNNMHESLSPLSGMVALFNIMLGEIIFGGVGSGLYGMILFVLLTVFIAGLMVGRTPEFLGKKVEAFEVKMTILAILAPSVVIKLFSAIACTVPAGLAGLTNNGPHGLTSIIYAFSSAAGNNGSAFAGLNTNTVFYNLLLGFGMIIGRYGVIVPVMAIAGTMGRKKVTPVSAGTFRTDTWLFVSLLGGIILIVGGLTFFPPLALGPVAEHFLMHLGVTF